MGIWQNSKLLADRFAAAGYLCLVADLYNGDALALKKPVGFDFSAWMREGSSGDNPHTEGAIDPIVQAAVGVLRGLGVERLGLVGYCFGAKYAVRHSKDGIRACFIAHPTFVSDDEFVGVSVPLSIAAAEKDDVFPAALRHRPEEILGGVGVPYQVCLYSGVAHGFSVRGSEKLKMERFGREAAFRQAVS